MEEMQLRNAVKGAAEIREGSYNEGEGTYAVSIQQAVVMAVREQGLPETVAPLISLAFTWWNDVLAWANGDYDGYPYAEAFGTGNKAENLEWRKGRIVDDGERVTGE